MANDSDQAFKDELTAALSGSGGGSGSKKPRNRQKEFDETQYQILASIYQGLWGEMPSPSYVLSKVKAGWSTTEFEFNERAKPAFRKSPRYAEESVGLSSSIASRLGVNG